MTDTKKVAEARKASKDAAAKFAENVKDAVAIMEDTQPTPTQEELNLANQGILVDDKEPTGAPPEGEVVTRHVSASAPAPEKDKALGAKPAGGYETR